MSSLRDPDTKRISCGNLPSGRERVTKDRGDSHLHKEEEVRGRYGRRGPRYLKREYYGTVDDKGLR